LEYADRCLVMSDGMLVGNTTDVLAAVLAYEKGMLMTERTDTAEKKEAVSQTGEIASADELSAIQNKQTNAEVDEKRFGSGRAI
ncbi:ABC transporter ATP-binding protein, partial [Acinetobacter baumannii]|nr:ABC transporter ATP-binding protein [Acinetobacter baumannii]